MNSLIRLEAFLLNPDILLPIILIILITGFIFAITNRVEGFFLKAHNIVKSIVDLILKPLDLIWDFIYKIILNLIHKALPPSTNPKFNKFGGRGPFIFIITITVLSPILIIIGLFFIPNKNEFVESFFMGMPPFNIILIMADGIDSVFKISELLLLVCLNAITLIFLKNQEECSKGIRIYYCFIFLIFSGCLAFYLSPIFSNPAVVNFFDIRNIYQFFIEDKSESFILLKILNILIFVPILYAFIATVGCAIKDLLALLAFSIKPFVVFMGVVALLSSFMQQGVWFTILMILTMCFTTFWAQHDISFEENLFQKIR